MDTKISVRDAMITKVITTTKETGVIDAAKMMLKHDIGGLVVVDGSEPIGIITEKDFTKILAKEANPHDLKISQAMSKKLVTISPDASIVDAAKLMTKSAVRKLPVMQGNNLAGIITAEDIVKVAPREIELLLELAAIKAQGSADFRQSATEGNCEVCGNYSDYLHQLGGSSLCNECKDAKE